MVYKLPRLPLGLNRDIFSFFSANDANSSSDHCSCLLLLVPTSRRITCRRSSSSSPSSFTPSRTSRDAANRVNRGRRFRHRSSASSWIPVTSRLAVTSKVLLVSSQFPLLPLAIYRPRVAQPSTPPSAMVAGASPASNRVRRRHHSFRLGTMRWSPSADHGG